MFFKVKLLTPSEYVRKYWWPLVEQISFLFWNLYRSNNQWIVKLCSLISAC